ncbi:MAG TPA: tyrosine-type recombinase/integrase [Verrucomicrobiae bacterium]|nr:tyrosine-type recombinase/integrase [Verrucomicrobiae bacterium]
MKQRYRVFRRSWGTYYCEDLVTKKQESLHTRDQDEAFRLVAAKNETENAPAFSLHLARVYWKAGDPVGASRTWQHVMDEILKLKRGETRSRWLTAIKDKAFDPIRGMLVLETQAEYFLRVLEKGSISTNVYLRRVQNFALDMNWLPWPVLPKKRWPVIKYKEKRAITCEEHQAVVACEHNLERRAFYQLAWHLGASQSDIAFLEADNIDWENRVISFARKKTGSIALMRIDQQMEAVLRSLPSSGPLFPHFRRLKAGDRATEFKQRCRAAGVEGVTLHSYRYAWAERAKKAGYPERFAQEALGHNSKAVHRAYARKAQVELPPLSEYERQRARFTGAVTAVEPMPRAMTVGL